MKIILGAFILSFFLLSCNDNEDIGPDLINEYLSPILINEDAPKKVLINELEQEFGAKEREGEERWFVEEFDHTNQIVFRYDYNMHGNKENPGYYIGVQIYNRGNIYEDGQYKEVVSAFKKMIDEFPVYDDDEAINSIPDKTFTVLRKYDEIEYHTSIYVNVFGK